MPLSDSESDWIPPGASGVKWFAIAFLLIMAIAVADSMWRERRPPAPPDRIFHIREIERPVVDGKVDCKPKTNINREACKLYRPDPHERTCLYVCVWPW